MTYDQLNDTYCSGCQYNQYPRTSGGIDLKKAYKLMVVGESPTALEAIKGQLMTGAGAQVLKKTFREVGLPYSEDEVFYTCAIRCAFPKKKGAKPPKDIHHKCHHSLIDLINYIHPKMVILCGGLAYHTYMNNNTLKVTEIQGALQDKKDMIPTVHSDIKIFPIMNPGVLIHAAAKYKPFLSSLHTASSIYNDQTQYDAGETRWTVIRSQEEVYALYTRMMALSKQNDPALNVVTLDMETTSLDYRIAEFCVLGICFELNHVYVLPRELRHLAHNFYDNVPWKCYWQNGMYDKRVIWKRGLGDVQIDGDSMYMHYILDETSPHDLGYLAKTYLNAPPYKYKMNQNWKAVTLETYDQFFEALCERVAVDCDYTRQVVFKLQAELNKEENKSLRTAYEELLIPGANFLSRVSQNGLLIDAPYLEQMGEKYQVLLVSIMDEIDALALPLWDKEQYLADVLAKSAPDKFNPGSPKQMSWMVFDRLKLKPRVRKGRSTDKDVLKTIEPMPPLVAKVLEYRKVQKEYSTYVLGLLDARDEDGRVRSTFTVHVTATGRLSSKEPNVQNQPSANGVGNIRKAFIAPEGYVLAEIDYAGAELRWLGFLSGCPVLGDVFTQGKNLHHETSVELFGPHYTKQQKMRAKAVNFGIPYGITAKSIADEHNLTVEEAQAMVDGWNTKYYGAASYLAWCAEQVLKGNYLETPYGRRRRFGLVTKATLHGLQNEARNFGIQSPSSDTTLLAAILMEEHLEQYYDTKILNLVHDSILLQIPANPETIACVGAYANDIMSSLPAKKFNCTIPFKTDFEIGTSWGDMVGFDWADSKQVFKEKVNDQGQEYLEYTNFHKWYGGNL